MMELFTTIVCCETETIGKQFIQVIWTTMVCSYSWDRMRGWSEQGWGSLHDQFWWSCSCSILLCLHYQLPLPSPPLQKQFNFSTMTLDQDRGPEIFLLPPGFDNLTVEVFFIRFLNCPCHLYGSMYHWKHNWAPHRLVYSKVYVHMKKKFLVLSSRSVRQK